MGYGSTKETGWPSGPFEWIVDRLGSFGSLSAFDLLDKKSVYSYEGDVPSAREVRKALEVLQKQDIVIKDPEGNYSLTDEGQWKYTDKIMGMPDASMSSSEWGTRRSLATEQGRHRNLPVPSECKECGGPLAEGGGYVGETVLYCPKGHGIAWEDSEDAIGRIY